MDQLPTEILLQIVKLLPKNDRKYFSQVCSRFHQIVCELEKFHRILRFKNYHFDDLSIFNMILTTRRRFKKIAFWIINRNISTVPALLDVHGEAIESMLLEISFDKLVEGDELISILKKLPNLCKLFLSFGNINITDCTMQGEVILPKLKYLKLKFLNEVNSTGNFLNFLPKNSLKSLEINGKFQEFESFIVNQAKSIEDLQIHEELCYSPQLFHNMKLKSFIIISNSMTYMFQPANINELLLAVIRDHPELEQVGIVTTIKRSKQVIEAKGELLKILLGMKHLKTIEFKVTGNNWNEVLQEVGKSETKEIQLEIENINSTDLQIILNQRLSNVTSLSFFHSNNLTADLCQNWKQLTRLQLDGRYSNDQIINLNSLLDKLPNLEYFHCSKKIEFTFSNQIYLKMKEMHFANLETTAVNFLNALPNLQILEIKEIQFNFEVLRKIASINLKDVKINFEVECASLISAKIELLTLLDQIFHKIPKIDINLAANKGIAGIIKLVTPRFHNVDYFFGKMHLKSETGNFKLCRKYPIDKNFPFEN